MKFSLNRVALLGFLPLALLNASCARPIDANRDPMEAYPQVHLTEYNLQYYVRVEQPIVSRVGAGQLQVNVPIRNRKDSDLNIDYIYYFTDKRGVQTQPPSSRQHLMIPRKGISQISFTSMSAADDFRVEIDWAK